MLLLFASVALHSMRLLRRRRLHIKTHYFSFYFSPSTNTLWSFIIFFSVVTS